MLTRVGIFVFLAASLLAQEIRGTTGKVLKSRSLPWMKRGSGYNSGLLQEIFDSMVRLNSGNFDRLEILNSRNFDLGINLMI